MKQKWRFLLLLASVSLWGACEPRSLDGDDEMVEGPAAASIEPLDDFHKLLDRWAEAEKARIQAEAELIKAQLEAEQAWLEIEQQFRQFDSRRPIRTPAAAPIVQEQEELDRKIASEVRRSIIRDESGRVLAEIARGIEIEVSGGVVTLHGTVRREEERDKVEERAHAVFGVRDVINQLQVQDNRAQKQPPHD